MAVGNNSQLKKTGDTIDNGIIRNKVGNSSGCYNQFITRPNRYVRALVQLIAE